MRFPDAVCLRATAPAGGPDTGERQKKLKDLAFAASIHREDIMRGAADWGVDLDEYIAFCVAAMQPIAAELGLLPVAE